ncbi:uncharacterized protein LOC131669681 [Phymastichus coffea]|uniref:uncharacterized protein LOC131669681 n=1 Tax=Phymastichus coffea TaxID=108790 RepID=UPI00273AC8DB|nr:uncharacterized protein LOC131669681 [Phymastichus coffea]
MASTTVKPPKRQPVDKAARRARKIRQQQALQARTAAQQEQAAAQRRPVAQQQATVQRQPAEQKQQQPTVTQQQEQSEEQAVAPQPQEQQVAAPNQQPREELAAAQEQQPQEEQIVAEEQSPQEQPAATQESQPAAAEQQAVAQEQQSQEEQPAATQEPQPLEEQAAAVPEDAAAQEQPQPPVEHEDQILEAIDQLRRRKARPDADRICNYLLRKFAVDARDTIADLHLLLESEKVIQVDYKGHTSYRNASKWTRLQLYKNRPEGFVKEKYNSMMVSRAVAQLLIADPDYLDQGVPALKLIEQLVEGVLNPTSKRMVEDFLGREVASGNLVKLSNGNYSMVPPNAGAAAVNGNAKGKISSTSAKVVSQPDAESDSKDSTDDQDSSSNTPKSNQTSKTDIENMETEDCYEIIVGRRPDDNISRSKDVNVKLENGYRKENKQNGQASNSPVAIKEEPKNGVAAQPTQRKSKTERKQRLCVRTDDSTDLEFKFESCRKSSSYKSYDDKKDEDIYTDEDDRDGDAGISSTNPSPTPSHTNAGGFRSARRKRAKKVFDPSDNMVVKKKRGRYSKVLPNQQDAQETKTATLKESPKDPNRQCSLCSKNKTESLIACRDCTVRAHPSCIYTPEEMIIKVNTSWQCERCKTCVVCYETSDVGPLVTCYNCDDAYHISCHTPRIPISKSKWYCSPCNQKHHFKSSSHNSSSNNNYSNNNNTSEHKSNNTTTATISRIITQVSPVRRSLEHPEEEEEAIDPNIPDASDWSIEQVFQYFYRYFPHESKIFKTEEIDGATLMLLKRSDIINKFGLLMGPALKIWRYVTILQHRRDDTKLYWL